MSLSYRLYQIGRELDTSGGDVIDTTVEARSSLDDFNTGSLSNTYWQIDVSDESALPSGLFYAQISGTDEIMAMQRASEVDGLTGDKVVIWVRGMFGTKVENISVSQPYPTILHIDSATPNLFDKVVKLDEVSDFDVTSVGEVEEAIEHKKGSFRINNASVTVRGVGRHRLRDAGSIQSPWVFEVYNSNDALIFQGFVREDVKYNASTQKTSFQAVSWLDILNKAGNIPARAIYETEVVNDRVFNTPIRSGLQIDVTNEDNLVQNGFGRGDTMAIETGKGEIRRLINSVATSADDSTVRLTTHLEDVFENIIYDSSGDIDPKINTISRNAADNQQLTSSNAITYSGYQVGAESDTDAQSVIEDIGDKEGYFVILLDSDNDVLSRIPIDKSEVSEIGGAAEQTWPRTFFAVLETENFDPFVPHDHYLITKGTGDSAFFEKLSNLDEGDKVRLLSKEAWGYDEDPDADDYPAAWKPDKLIEALLTVQDESGGQQILGILPQIFGTVSYGLSGTEDSVWDEIDPIVEFPTKPIEALRMIQQSSGLSLTENVSVVQNGDGDDIPSVSYELLPRKLMLEDSNSDTLDNVVSWSETVTESGLDAVVIEPNEQYRGGGDIPKAMGWYYDSVQSDEETDKPKRTTVPEGEKVVTIKTNTLPSHTGVEYSGGGEVVRRDERLSALARSFYEHFKNANREVEIEVGRDNPDVLAKYVGFDEGPIVDDFVLVTKKSHSLKENHFSTTLTGRIGKISYQAESTPNVVIQGTSAFSADENNDVEVSLTGVNSWDAADGSLSYQWKYRQKGSTTSWNLSDGNVNDGGTGVKFLNTFSGVTSFEQWEIRLEVTNNNTGAVGTTEKTIALQPFRDTVDETASNEVDYEKTQVTKNVGGDDLRFGRLEITPKIIPNIDRGDADSDGNDEYFVEYIAAKGKEVDVDTSNDANWVAVGETDASNPYSGISDSVELTDGSGNVTGFQIDVELAKKHVSNILTRIRWSGSTGFANQRRAWTFDFDSVAEVANLAVYTDLDGNLYVDVEVDEDTQEFDVQYAIDDTDGSGGWTTVSGSPFSSDQSNLNTGATLSDGQSGTVRIVPRNFDGVQGNIRRQTTYYDDSSQSQTGTFDSITINGAGTIDSIQQDVFRFQDTASGGATFTGVQEIRDENGNNTYARTDENETFTSDVYVQGSFGVGTTNPDEIVKIDAGGVDSKIEIEGSNLLGYRIDGNGTIAASWLLQYRESTGSFRIVEEDRNELVFSSDINGQVGLSNVISPNYNLEVSGQIGRNYNSGTLGAGYLIDEDVGNGRSLFEMDNLRVRGELYANTFVKEKVRAQNGYVFYTSATTFTEDVTTPANTGSGNTFTAYVKENVFVAGDRIWYKDISSDSSLTINSVELVVDPGSTINSVQRNGETVYEVTLYVNNAAGTSTVIKGGGTAVRIGSSDSARQGSVLVDTESSFAPFLDIYDGVSNWSEFQSASKLKARLGNLDGVGATLSNGTSPSGYGLYSENVYLEGEIVAASGEIAGWTINTEQITRSFSGGTIEIGEIVTDRTGIEVADADWEINAIMRDPDGPEISSYDKNNSNFLFQLGHTNQIAGWSFTSSLFSSSGDDVQLDSSGEIRAGYDSDNTVYRTKLNNLGLQIITNDPSEPQRNRVEWFDESSNSLGYVSADGNYNVTQNESDATLQLLGGFNILMNLDGRSGSFQMREWDFDATKASFLMRGGIHEFQGPASADGIVFTTESTPTTPYIDIKTMSDGETEPTAPTNGWLRLFVSQEDGAAGDDSLQLGLKEPAGNTTFINP